MLGFPRGNPPREDLPTAPGGRPLSASRASSARSRGSAPGTARGAPAARGSDRRSRPPAMGHTTASSLAASVASCNPVGKQRPRGPHRFLLPPPQHKSFNPCKYGDWWHPAAGSSSSERWFVGPIRRSRQHRVPECFSSQPPWVLSHSVHPHGRVGTWAGLHEEPPKHGILCPPAVALRASEHLLL